MFRSPAQPVISVMMANGERAKGITTSSWRPRRPVIKLPLRGKPQLISNVQGRSRLADSSHPCDEPLRGQRKHCSKMFQTFLSGDRSLSRRTAAQP
ncbi:hypothetical protein ACEU59_11025 [Buttiauxella noackiae]|uniref:hypothetical protein n=1 Tax=Buttiauxella noackiae TaxID=82992 RepID=UPI0035A6B4B6